MRLITKRSGKKEKKINKNNLMDYYCRRQEFIKWMHKCIPICSKVVIMTKRNFAFNNNTTTNKDYHIISFQFYIK